MRGEEVNMMAVTASESTARWRQDPAVSFVKRERWTEAGILNLPTGEHDWFDRKSGQTVEKDDPMGSLAKHVCAFANTGGGHLIIGVKDDERTFDGVAPSKGRTPIREWVEQKLPMLLDPPLQGFAVHDVNRNNPSGI